MGALAVTKMHGARNDFIVADLRSQRLRVDPHAFARRWCDRRSGIGADGVLLIEACAHADAAMRVINADGSEAEMCGNGIRCIARYLYERGEGTAFSIATLGGRIGAAIVSEEPVRVRVDVGTPLILQRSLALGAVAVRVGNPHVVIFAPDVDAYDLEHAAAAFPDTNVHVAQIEEPNALRVRHFERGAGFTQACGTGAVACAAAAIVLRDLQTPVTVEVPGGILIVDWDGEGSAFLTGPAERIFDAAIDP